MLADILVHQGAQADAIEQLRNVVSEFGDNDAKASALDKISEIYEAAGDGLMAAKALEHALELTPSDKDRRFTLAYLYSQHHQRHLALFHYKILTDQDATYSSALNNLGVIYDELKLPVNRVETWRRAADWGETYPLGNLAIKLIKQGFYDEARRILDTVPLEARNDERVAHAIGLMDPTRKQENEKLEKHLEAVNVQHKYMLLAVELEQDPDLRQLTCEDLFDNWTSADGADMTLSSLKAGGLQAVLTEVAISGGLGSIIGPMSTPSREKYNLYLNQSGLLLTGTAYPVDPPVGGLLGLGRPSHRNYFLVIQSRATISGIHWSEDTNVKEITFNRS